MSTKLAGSAVASGKTQPSPLATTPPSQRFAKVTSSQTTGTKPSTTATTSGKAAAPAPSAAHPATSPTTAALKSDFLTSPPEALTLLQHVVSWVNSFKLGGSFDEPISDPRQLSDGILLYLVCEKAVPSAFTEASGLSAVANTKDIASSPSGGPIRFMKRANLKILFNGVSDFAISELKADASFDLNALVDLNKISDLVPARDSNNSVSSVASAPTVAADEEGLKALATLCEYVLATAVLSNSSEVISRMRVLPSADQRPLSASVKKVMTLHNLQKSTERINTANTSCGASLMNAGEASPEAATFGFNGSFARPSVISTVVAISTRRDSSVGAGSCAFESHANNTSSPSAMTGRYDVASYNATLAGTNMTQSEIDLTANLMQEIRLLKNDLRDMTEELSQATNKLAVSEDVCASLRAQAGGAPSRSDLSEKEFELMRTLKERETQLNIATADAASSSVKLAEAKKLIGNLELKQREFESEASSQKEKGIVLTRERAELLDRIYELEFEQKAHVLREHHLKTRLADVEAENDLFRIKGGMHGANQSPSNLSADFVDEDILKASVIDSDEVADLKRKLQSTQLELNICRQKIAFGSIVDFGMASMRHGRTESVISNAPGTDLLSSTTRKARPIGTTQLSELHFADDSLNLESAPAMAPTRFKIKPSKMFDPRSDDLGGRAVIHVSNAGEISLECENGALRAELLDLLEKHEELLEEAEHRKHEPAPPPPVMAPRVAQQTKTEGKGCCAVM